MRSSKDRPQSANFKKIVKPRIASAYKPQQPQAYNPWSTVYAEANKLTDKKNTSTRAPNDFSDLMSVKSAMSNTNNAAKPNTQGERNPARVTANKENANAHAGGSNENLYTKTANSFFAKKSQVRNKNGSSKQSQKSVTSESQVGQPADALLATVNSIVRKPDNITNPLGQKETFLDPNDATHCPAHTRLIANPNDGDFLKKNLHTLYRAPNEYYPLLGGECLCGYCICGNCKCVHMKFKNKEQNAIGQTIHATDFGEHDTPFCNKQIIRGPQMQKPLNEFVKDSTYKVDYPGHRPDGAPALNKGKQNNLGPCATNVKAPIAQMTQHKLDYPDWGYAKAEPLNIAPLAPFTKKLPIDYKTQNQDYGAFFNDEDMPALQAPAKHIQKKSNNFFGPQLPMDYGTQHRADYTRKNPEHTGKRLPKDNLYADNEKFDTKFRSIKQDYGDHPKAMICPMKERVRLVKDLIKTYALDNRIPL